MGGNDRRLPERRVPDPAAVRQPRRLAPREHRRPHAPWWPGPDNLHPRHPAGCQAAAQRNEGERVRLTRLRGHIVAATITGLIFVALFTSMQNVAGFIAAIIFLYLALQSLVDAVTVLLGAAWTWTRDPGGPERMSWSGRLVLAAMERLRERELAAVPEEENPAIIVLPPDHSE